MSNDLSLAHGALTDLSSCFFRWLDRKLLEGRCAVFLGLQGTRGSTPHPVSLTLLFLLHSDQHYLPSGPRLFSCRPSDLPTCTFQSTPECFLQIKIGHTSFFVTLQFRMKPSSLSWHTRPRTICLSRIISNLPFHVMLQTITCSSHKPRNELLCREPSPDPLSAW